MQKILGLIRKAIHEFDLIEDGDKVAVGVSGGKDSLILLEGLGRIKTFLPVSFDIIAITLDLKYDDISSDYSSIQEMCNKYNIPYIVQSTNIADVVFNIKKESHPCSLCARMRRGALHDAAKKNNCNKIAFGHHFDDAIETFIMNLFNEGRIDCFSPKTYLSRKDITLIRPLVFAKEQEIIRVTNKLDLTIIKNKCPVDGKTNRQITKEFLAEKEKADPGFKDRIFGAIRRKNINGWGFK